MNLWWGWALYWAINVNPCQDSGIECFWKSIANNACHHLQFSTTKVWIEMLSSWQLRTVSLLCSIMLMLNLGKYPLCHHHHHHHQCSANDGWKTIAHTRNRAPGELLLLQGDCEYCIYIDLLLQGSNWSILLVSDTDCGPGFSNCNLFPTGQFYHLRGVIASMHPIPTLQLQLHSEMNCLECVRALSMCVLINSK